MLALSSLRISDPRGRLEPLAKSATALGFLKVYVEAPPLDPAAARAAFEAEGVSVVAVAARPCNGAPSLARAADDAAAAAAGLKIRRIVVDAWRVPSAVTEEAREKIVLILARSLHGILIRHAGLSIAIRNAEGADGLVGFREMEWLLSDLKGRGLDLWFDPARARDVASAGKEPTPLDWADRYGPNIAGVTIAPVTKEGDLVRPEETGVDWGTLRESVPSAAARVLEVGPKPTDERIVETRRRFEQDLGW